MRIISTALATLSLVLMGVPAFADAAIPGRWHCTIRGVSAGDLTTSTTSYTYRSSTDAEPRPGTLRIAGKLVYVMGGPLKDDLGIKLGHFAGPPDLPSYYTSGDPFSVLVLSLNAGKAMKCLPSYPDPLL